MGQPSLTEPETEENLPFPYCEGRGEFTKLLLSPREEDSSLKKKKTPEAAGEGGGPGATSTGGVICRQPGSRKSRFWHNGQKNRMRLNL